MDKLLNPVLSARLFVTHDKILIFFLLAKLLGDRLAIFSVGLMCIQFEGMIKGQMAFLFHCASWNHY